MTNPHPTYTLPQKIFLAKLLLKDLPPPLGSLGKFLKDVDAIIEDVCIDAEKRGHVTMEDAEDIVSLLRIKEQVIGAGE